MSIRVIHTRSESPCTLLKALTEFRVSIQNSCAEWKYIKGVLVWPELNTSSPRILFLIVCVNKFVALFALCIMRSDSF